MDDGVADLVGTELELGKIGRRSRRDDGWIDGGCKVESSATYGLFFSSSFSFQRGQKSYMCAPGSNTEGRGAEDVVKASEMWTRALVGLRHLGLVYMPSSCLAFP